MKDETQFQSRIPTENNHLFSVESDKKIVDALNALVQINNDRIEGYVRASEETTEPDLMRLFNEMAANSRINNIQLAEEVRKYGGQPTSGTTTLGKVFRVWMDFKATLTGKDRKAILVSCEFGEDAAQDTYADIIISERELLPEYLLKLISQQKALIREDHNHVKSLRDRE